MIIKQDIPRARVIRAIQCDVCKTTYDRDKDDNDWMEIQEFLSWRDTCGYGNKTFGDMSVVELDMCQYCVKAKLGDYVRVRAFEA